MKITGNVMGAVLMLLSTGVLFNRIYAQEQNQTTNGAAAHAMRTQQQSASAEENLVKTAYGKLSLYHRAANAEKARERHIGYDPENDIKFDLQGIHTGPIEEIQNRPYGEMVTKPDGDVILVALGVRTFNGGPEAVLYEAKWVKSNYTSTALEDWEHTTVGEMLRMMGDSFGDIGKYTSYQVTARLAGKERTYRAMVLYHGPPQSAAQPKVEFADNIVGQAALSNALKEKRLPVRPAPKHGSDRLKINSAKQSDDEASPNREDPDGGYAQHWSSVSRRDLGAALMEKDESEEIYRVQFLPGGDITICDDGFCCVDDPFTCDPTSCYFADPFVCGPGSGPPPPPESCPNGVQVIGQHNLRDTPDFQFHITGKHKAKSDLVNTCLINSDCSTVCRVEIASAEISESFLSITTNACHVVGLSSKFEDGFPGCKTTVGYAAKACLFCQCSVTISIGPFGTSSDGFWTTEHSYSASCSSEGTPIP
jgi:hypothetical protein